MRTQVKWMKILVVALGVLPLGEAGARVPPPRSGAFLGTIHSVPSAKSATGASTSGTSAEVLVLTKTATIGREGDEVTLALVLKKEEGSFWGVGSKTRMGLFKVETLKDDSQTWVSIGFSKDLRLLETGERGFSVSYLDEDRLNLVPFGDLTSWEQVQGTLTRTQHWEWRDGPRGKTVLTGLDCNGLAFDLPNHHLSGFARNVWASDKKFYIDMQVEDFFPGLWLMYPTQDAPGARRGKKTLPEIGAVGAWIYYTGSGIFGSSEQSLRLLEPGDGDSRVTMNLVED